MGSNLGRLLEAITTGLPDITGGPKRDLGRGYKEIYRGRGIGAYLGEKDGSRIRKKYKRSNTQDSI